MDIFYKKIKANVTPEVLAQLHSKKIILESTNQQQTKGRYSVVIFDIYGTLTLDNDVLLKKICQNSTIKMFGNGEIYMKINSFFLN